MLLKISTVLNSISFGTFHNMHRFLRCWRQHQLCYQFLLYTSKFQPPSWSSIRHKLLTFSSVRHELLFNSVWQELLFRSVRIKMLTVTLVDTWKLLYLIEIIFAVLTALTALTYSSFFIDLDLDPGLVLLQTVIHLRIVQLRFRIGIGSKFAIAGFLSHRVKPLQISWLP